MVLEAKAHLGWDDQESIYRVFDGLCSNRFWASGSLIDVQGMCKESLFKPHQGRWACMCLAKHLCLAMGWSTSQPSDWGLEGGCGKEHALSKHNTQYSQKNFVFLVPFLVFDMWHLFATQMFPCDGPVVDPPFWVHFQRVGTDIAISSKHLEKAGTTSTMT